MQTIILLGAPGAGKGTVAELIKRAAGYIHVSTGDILRAAVKAGSPVGLEAKSYMEKGELVPDAVIMGIVREFIAAQPAGSKFMFDGFPRTPAQAEGLDALLAEFQGAVDAVFQLDVPRDVLVSRLSGRRVCRQCGAVYHVTNIPTRVSGVCDQCGGATYQRPDDNEATVLNRLDVYKKQTEPLIRRYKDRGALVTVPAAGSKETTQRFIMDHLPSPRA